MTDEQGFFRIESGYPTKSLLVQDYKTLPISSGNVVIPVEMYDKLKESQQELSLRKKDDVHIVLLINTYAQGNPKNFKIGELTKEKNIILSPKQEIINKIIDSLHKADVILDEDSKNKIMSDMKEYVDNYVIKLSKENKALREKIQALEEVKEKSKSWF